jgi:hypothetical protein
MPEKQNLRHSLRGKDLVFTSPTPPARMAENEYRTFTIGATHLVSPSSLFWDTKLEWEVDVEQTKDMMVREIKRGASISSRPPVRKAVDASIAAVRCVPSHDDIPETPSTHVLSTVSSAAFLLPKGT